MSMRPGMSVSSGSSTTSSALSAIDESEPTAVIRLPSTRT